MAQCVRENALERRRDTVELQPLDEESGVEDLPAAERSHETTELSLRGASSLRGLLPEDPERSELALRLDDPLHLRWAERADQLVLEVLDADEEAEGLHISAGEPGAQAGALEAAEEIPLLPGVAEAREPAVESAGLPFVEILSAQPR